MCIATHAHWLSLDPLNIGQRARLLSRRPSRPLQHATRIRCLELYP